MARGETIYSIQYNILLLLLPYQLETINNNENRDIELRTFPRALSSCISLLCVVCIRALTSGKYKARTSEQWRYAGSRVTLLERYRPHTHARAMEKLENFPMLSCLSFGALSDKFILKIEKKKK